MTDRGARDDDEAPEVRILLERGVPRLSPPAGRLDQVRTRIVRRRRRRRTGAVLLGAVAVAGLLVVPQLITAPGAERSSSAADSPTPTLPGGGATVRFPQLRELTVALPAGWSVTAVQQAPEFTIGYVASQALDAPAKSPACEPKAVEVFACAPLSQPLEPGGAIVAFQVFEDSHHKATGKTLGVVQSEQLGTFCRKLGGERLLTAIADARGTDRPAMILASVCLDGSATDASDTAPPGATDTSSPGLSDTSSPGLSGTSSPGVGETSSPGTSDTTSPGAPASASSGLPRTVQALLDSIAFDAASPQDKVVSAIPAPTTAPPTAD
ncbi:hypothetical protein ACIQAC_10035 [Streptomyces sp. NPDC088387]|uniref:hypothetical protein n=1 Tax=Streptomyces sp. NPDC088387 TaxID=3365859 RepID=UPI003822FFBB